MLGLPNLRWRKKIPCLRANARARGPGIARALGEFDDRRPTLGAVVGLKGSGGEGDPFAVSFPMPSAIANHNAGVRQLKVED
jgi:hypothetical protein